MFLSAEDIITAITYLVPGFIALRVLYHFGFPSKRSDGGVVTGGCCLIRSPMRRTVPFAPAHQARPRAPEPAHYAPSSGILERRPESGRGRSAMDGLTETGADEWCEFASDLRRSFNDLMIGWQTSRCQLSQTCWSSTAASRLRRHVATRRRRSSRQGSF